jgi:hypothetical protein
MANDAGVKCIYYSGNKTLYSKLEEKGRRKLRKMRVCVSCWPKQWQLHHVHSKDYSSQPQDLGTQCQKLSVYINASVADNSHLKVFM